MKSKIEKIEFRLVKDMDTKRDIQNIYQCLIELAIKTNELIEAHNSQSQPEEKGRIGCEYSDCYKCPKCNDELLVTCLHPLELLCTRCREYVELEEIEDTPEKELTDKKKDVDKGVDRQDTPEEWICPKCGFDDCYQYKNSEDFRLMYCPACSELVKLNNKKK